MHDPLHVIVTVRSPIPNLLRPWPKRGPGLAIWAFRGRTWFGTGDEEIRVPLRRRAFLSAYRWRGFKREWPMPTIFTVWHRDPEADGTDSSCRNAIRVRQRAAVEERRYLAAAGLGWWMRHYDVFHVHHWSLQFNLAQTWRRRLLTRCETCGHREGRKRGAVNVHVVVDQAAENELRGKRSFRQRWLTGERNLHHWGQCQALASVRATKASLPGWLSSWGHDEITMRMQREREPYYGCYPWWREWILGEDPQTAEERAAAHVQRSVHPCGACNGAGVLMDVAGPVPCEPCEGTGHERVDEPIPAALV